MEAFRKEEFYKIVVISGKKGDFFCFLMALIRMVTPFAMKICTHLDRTPVVPTSAYIAKNATLIGDVELGECSSVWYDCTLRADIQSIRVGEGSNIQDGTVIHLSSDLGTIVGDYVTVGHKALLHACTIGDEVLVGMGSIVMDGAVVGARSIIGAGSLITKGTIIPPGSLVMGSPAKIVKTLDLDEQQGIRAWAEKYVKVAAEHREMIG